MSDTAPIADDAELQRCIDRLDVLLATLDIDDPRIEELGNRIEEYETRTDILNRPPDGSETR